MASTGKEGPARFEWRLRRYLAVDGGSGAHLLAALAGLDPRLQPVASPRQADLLIVVEPISRALVPAVAEVARALPRPAQALLVGPAGPNGLPGASLAGGEEAVPGARRVVDTAPDRVLAATLDPAPWPALTVADRLVPASTTVPLPPKQTRELATELTVLSLGPLQPVTAGPCRFLLVCDGEQVRSAQIEAGYALRGIGAAMQAVTWREAGELAAQLDPLAPAAGRLAYVQALEMLQGWQPPAAVLAGREAVLALERAQNHLWWLARFARQLAAAALAERARQVALALADLSRCFWPEPPAAWLAPGAGADLAGAGAADRLRRLADEADGLRARVARDRWLALRTRGLGVLAADRLAAAGVSGPVLLASEQGAGDVHGRGLTRLGAAARDLRAAGDHLTRAEPVGGGQGRWEAPPGEARVTVAGPRGQVGLQVASDGGDRPTGVTWQRPSAALLALAPEVLAGQKLADAEVIVASLDLAMAEADG